MFDNPFSMVVAIVAIVMVTSVLKARYRARHGIVADEKGNERLARGGDAAAMRSEIAALKERIIVLERVITDNHSATVLDREIEKLR